MILLFLTAIIPVAVAAFPGLSRHTPILIDSTETCQFRAGSKHYDLCPIFGGAAVQSPLLVKEGQTEYRFHFGLDSGVMGSSHDHASHCPSGARICLISKNPFETTEAIGSSIITVYSEVDGERPAAVRFVCDHQTQLGQPVFSGVENSLHSFIWRTKYGCATTAQASDESILKALDSEADVPPSGDSSESPEPSEPNEEDQLLESDRQRKSRRSTAIIFAVIFIIIISLSIISYKYPDRLNIFLTEHIQPIFHRLSLDHLPRFSLPNSLKPAGEGRLVRWAHEDLELDEDFMVNGSDAFDETDDNGDEYIPLRPSPRKGGRGVKNYGSATSPFW
ncbi:hypothetical protein B0H13DRAFT_2012289 [Mycena leptocephala]|nr:hypothetical protein B0H13DRAFT_2012289 [Mycena leptocephala]